MVRGRYFGRGFNETIPRPLQHGKLQTPVSRGNMYKVNIESVPGCFDLQPVGFASHFEHFSECEEPIQQGERWMQIRANCSPGARPSKCIKLIAMQNGC